MEKRITDCDLVKGTRYNYIYATFEGAEIRVIGKLPKTVKENNFDDFVGLTESQAKVIISTRFIAH